MKKTALLLLILFTVFSFSIRLFLIRNNNLFFTVDQGRDAIYAREILTRQQIFLKGPETNIRGIFAGPLVDYYNAFWYFVFQGHPVGAAVGMMFLNIVVSVLLILWLKDKIGLSKSFVLASSLQVVWSFFETSLWGFHPFALVALSFFLLWSLVNFLESEKREGVKYYLLSLFLCFLAFNAEVAAAIALFVFTLGLGFVGVKRNIISDKFWLLFGVFLPVVGALFFAKDFVFQLLGGVSATSIEGGRNAGRVFESMNFETMFYEFGNILVGVTTPHSLVLGLSIFVISVYLFYKNKRGLDAKIKNFIALTFLLFGWSFIFFATNMGHRSWHTVYLPALMFVSLVLIFFHIPRKVGMLFLSLVVLFQLINFTEKYMENRVVSTNPSILYNQISTIDWIYETASSQGFRVYNYADTFYDYPYQYLFWWYAREKYGYLPDEYANFPLSHKELYVPGSKYYADPNRNGEGLKYLIIQSETNGEDNRDWIERFREYHDKVDETKVGSITLEKYLRKNEAPNDPCIWQGRCSLE